MQLFDDQDAEIIMHCDVHFGSNWPVMIDYYEKEGIGCHHEFDLERIKALAEIDPPLPEWAQEEVERAKGVYINLRDQEPPHPLRDLILTEEEHPAEAIEALAQQPEMLEPLIKMIKADTFYNPLYPGYGRTPIHAAHILGKMQNAKAIAPLFEAIGQGDFDADEAMISALKQIGTEAKAFLLLALDQKPLSLDNERAAIALTHFSHDEEVSKKALKLLQDPDISANESLAPYLIQCCASLKDPSDRKLFEQLGETSPFALDFKSILGMFG